MDENTFEKIKTLVEQRNELIAQKPELQALQDEIDEALLKAGNNKHERNRVLQEKLLNSWYRIVDAWDKK